MRLRRKGKWRKAVVYPLGGLSLSFLFPAGWLILAVARFSPHNVFAAFRQVPLQLEDHSLLYVYLLACAVVTLTICGLALGLRDDRIQEHVQKLTSQRRLLGIKNRQLARLSITDRLTGLANYFRFHEVLALEFKRAQRYSLELCVIMVDVDYFKKINDRFGHLYGDFVLYELGQIFATSRRETDYVARTGGEEFSFLLTQTSVNDAIRFAERLREMVEKARFEHHGIRSDVSISVGVASIHDLPPNVGKDSEKQLLAYADEALYEAKRRGRNRVVRYGLRPREFTASA